MPACHRGRTVLIVTSTFAIGGDLTVNRLGFGAMRLAGPGVGGPPADIAADHHATPSQLALAWLLKRSAVMLPIPGTSKAGHLEENVAAAQIELTDAEFETLSKAGEADG